MSDYYNLIKQLRARKEALGMTQVQIAEIMGKERVRVNELFSSKKTNMTVKTLLKLCNALNVEINLTESKYSSPDTWKTNTQLLFKELVGKIG